jgi:hypothetical protein
LEPRLGIPFGTTIPGGGFIITSRWRTVSIARATEITPRRSVLAIARGALAVTRFSRPLGPRSPFRTQLVPRQGAVAVPVELLQGLGGMLDLVSGDLTIAICVDGSHHRRPEHGARAVRTPFAVPRAFPIARPLAVPRPFPVAWTFPLAGPIYIAPSVLATLLVTASVVTCTFLVASTFLVSPFLIAGTLLIATAFVPFALLDGRAIPRLLLRQARQAPCSSAQQNQPHRALTHKRLLIAWKDHPVAVPFRVQWIVNCNSLPPADSLSACRLNRAFSSWFRRILTDLCQVSTRTGVGAGVRAIAKFHLR